MATYYCSRMLFAVKYKHEELVEILKLAEHVELLDEDRLAATGEKREARIVECTHQRVPANGVAQVQAMRAAYIAEEEAVGGEP